MFFVLPTGHTEAVVHRIPWVTILIALLCLGMQFHAMGAVTTEDVVDVQRDLIALDEDVVEEFLGLDYVDHGDEAQQLLQEFHDGELVEDNDPLWVRYQELTARERELKVDDPVMAWGYTPGEPRPGRIITYAFVHGGWFHLLGNLFFLYLVGCNLEDRWGRLAFAGFYLAGAAVAGLTYAAWHPDTTVPIVGASGAVAAAMGGFLVVLWAVQIRFVYFLWFMFYVRAGSFLARTYIVLPLWFMEQALASWIEYDADSQGGVAYSAHVGGFVFGVVVGLVMRFTGLDEKLAARNEGEVVFEENEDYADAVTRATRDPIGAFAQLRAVVAERPDHGGARFELTQLLRDAPASATFVAEVDRYIQEQAAANRHGEVTQAYKTLLTRRVAGLSARGLLAVAQSGHTINDAELVVRATRDLMHQHPDSPLIPRAMHDVASVQLDAGRTDLAAKTLTNLIERYPTDAVADQARAELERLGRLNAR